MMSERLFNSFIHHQKLLYLLKQISGYAPGTNVSVIEIVYKLYMPYTADSTQFLAEYVQRLSLRK